MALDITEPPNHPSFFLSLNYSFHETEKDGPERFYSEDCQQHLCMQTVSFGLLGNIEKNRFNLLAAKTITTCSWGVSRC